MALCPPPPPPPERPRGWGCVCRGGRGVGVGGPPDPWPHRLKGVPGLGHWGAREASPAPLRLRRGGGGRGSEWEPPEQGTAPGAHVQHVGQAGYGGAVGRRAAVPLVYGGAWAMPQGRWAPSGRTPKRDLLRVPPIPRPPEGAPSMTGPTAPRSLGLGRSAFHNAAGGGGGGQWSHSVGRLGKARDSRRGTALCLVRRCFPLGGGGGGCAQPTGRPMPFAVPPPEPFVLWGQRSGDGWAMGLYTAPGPAKRHSVGSSAQVSPADWPHRRCCRWPRPHVPLRLRPRHAHRPGLRVVDTWTLRIVCHTLGLVLEAVPERSDFWLHYCAQAVKQNADSTVKADLVKWLLDQMQMYSVPILEAKL